MCALLASAFFAWSCLLLGHKCLAVGAYVSWFLSPKQIMPNHVKSWQIMQKHAPDFAWKCLILPESAWFCLKMPDFVFWEWLKVAESARCPENPRNKKHEFVFNENVFSQTLCRRFCCSILSPFLPDYRAKRGSPISVNLVLIAGFGLLFPSDGSVFVRCFSPHLPCKISDAKFRQFQSFFVQRVSSTFILVDFQSISINFCHVQSLLISLSQFQLVSISLPWSKCRNLFSLCSCRSSSVIFCFDFSRGNLENLVGNLEGIFRGFFRPTEQRLKNFGEIFGAFFVRKFVARTKSSVQNSLCRRATLRICWQPEGGENKTSSSFQFSADCWAWPKAAWVTFPSDCSIFVLSNRLADLRPERVFPSTSRDCCCCKKNGQPASVT